MRAVVPWAELCPAGQIGVGVCVLVQPQHRGAPPAHGEADLGVELAGAIGSEVAGLGEQQLELCTVQLFDHDGMAVLVDEWDLGELVGEAH